MSNFINQISTFCQKIHENGGNLLPSVSIAQAILESGWGESELAKKGNNLFGIKGSFSGQYVEFDTKEYYNGNWVTVKAKFRKYPSYYESLVDHDNLIDLSIYTKVRNCKTYDAQCKALQSCGYATDPCYAQKLIDIIDSYNLIYYDKRQSPVIIYSENKKFKITTDVLNVRDNPSTKTGKIVAKYYKNETFYSSGYCENQGYIWRTYISYSGERRFVATRTVDNKEIYVKEV